MNTERIEELVVALSKTPFDPEINFQLAAEYERLDQTASAISFYLRAVEYGNQDFPLLVYTSLLRMSMCFANQRDRNWTVSGVLLQAIEYLPTRPEAWFLMSRFHEREGNWQECYTFAEVGLVHSSKYDTYDSLPLWVEYPGAYALMFEKAVSAWWVGRKSETIRLLTELSKMNLAPEFENAVLYNMQRLGMKKTEEGINSLEPVIMNYRKYFGNTASTIFDIGTRDGDDANFLAKALNSSIVYAIDANPDAVEATLERYPWMRVRHTAIADGTRETTFQRVRSTDETKAGCSSIYAQKVAEDIDFKGLVDVITVPMKRMADFLVEEGLTNTTLDVVKVDTEGYTWQVLEGMGDTIYQVKLFHLETERHATHAQHRNNKQVADYMRSKGFLLVDISHEWGWGIQDQVWVNPRLAIANKEVFREPTV